MKKLAFCLVLLSLCVFSFSLTGCNNADEPVEGAADSVDEGDAGDDGSATTDEGSDTTDGGAEEN